MSTTAPSIAPVLINLSDQARLIHGDALTALRLLDDNSIDAICTDPPYGLSDEPDPVEVLTHWLAGDDYTHQGSGFMGKSWDSFVPGPAIWREAFRVLKPGGYALSFSSTRTYDLMTVAMRLAGFEVRDTIHWTFSQGFPKSHNIAAALTKAGRDDLAEEYAGYGTALKPSHELIAVVRKPLTGTYAQTVIEHGTGALNIDGCRVKGVREETSDPSRSGEATATKRYTTKGSTNFAAAPGPRGGSPDGRFPSNTLLTHSPDCVEVGTITTKAPTINRFTDGAKPFGGGAGHAFETVQTGDANGNETLAVFECVEGCPIRELDEQSGILKSGKPGTYRGTPNNSATYGAESRKAGEAMTGFGDSGGASRFFPRFKYEKKAKGSERVVVWVPAPSCRPAAKTGQAGCGPDPHDATTDWQVAASVEPTDCMVCGTPWVAYEHSTVKPPELMKWLTRLVTPAGGTVLDLFAGTGTTGVAAVAEGFRPVLVERDPVHVAMIHKRLTEPIQTSLFGSD
jgi:DNA modification methylase